MSDTQRMIQVEGQKYQSLPTDPPPSYNEVVTTQPSAPSLHTIDAVSCTDIVTAKPSAPILEPSPYDDGFNHVGPQTISNTPYNTTTYAIPANHVEGIPYVGRSGNFKEEDGCCSCEDGCEGCVTCLSACNCVLQCCTLILEIISSCNKN